VSDNLPAVTNLRLLHITLNLFRAVEEEELEKTFNKAIDYAHYAPNCWLVLTSSNVERWQGRLMPLLGDNDTLLICEVQPASIHGWIQNWIIEWIVKSKRRILNHE
jgi:hypothetical protein